MNITYRVFWNGRESFVDSDHLDEAVLDLIQNAGAMPERIAITIDEVLA